MSLFAPKSNWKARLALCLVALQACFVLAACMGQKSTVQFNHNFAWHVQDPILSRFIPACSGIELEASGSFRAGTANFRGLKINTDDGTDFIISLKMPIDKPDQIDFGAASGFLSLTKPVKIGGVPFPQKVTLEPGKASAQLDFAGGLGDFLMNIITAARANGDTDSGALQNIVASIKIKSMTVYLAEGKPLTLGRLHLLVGPHSTVSLCNLTLDEKLDFRGKADAELVFKPGCEYVGKHASFRFNGGKARLHFLATKTGNQYSFTAEPSGSVADLTDCRYLFGKYQQCEASSHQADLHIGKFTCEDVPNQQFPKFLSQSSMLLHNSKLLIRNPRKTFALSSNFSNPIPARLELAGENGQLSAQWWTEKTNEADNVTMDITPNSSTTRLVLGKTVIGPVQLTKEGDLDFSFDKGVSALKQLAWSNDKRSFKMTCRDDSTISIPPGMSMQVLKDETGTATQLPLNLDVDKAVITSSKGGETELNNLKGKVTLTVDNGTKLVGDLTMALVSCSLLGSQEVDLQANGLSITSDKDGAQVGLDSCKLNITNAAMSSIINEQIPTEQRYDVNKPLLEKQKWRYRNAILTHVTVKDLAISQLVAESSGVEKFQVSGNAHIDGTVEKGGLLSIIKKQKRGWEVRPWSASGRVEGEGLLSYKPEPTTPLTRSKVGYVLRIDLKPAKDVDLDWSQVDEGILSKPEHAIVTKFISSYDPKPFEKKGTLDVFKERSKKLDCIVVNGIKTDPTDDGLAVRFSSHVRL